MTNPGWEWAEVSLAERWFREKEQRALWDWWLGEDEGYWKWCQEQDELDREYREDERV